MTPKGIEIGTEHQPRCPDTNEKLADEGYCHASRQATMRSEQVVLLALEAAMIAIEPWWCKALGYLVRVLWFLRGLAKLVRDRYWQFDHSLGHRAFATCTWSAVLVVPDEGLRLVALREARLMLRGWGYVVEDVAFNLAPGTLPLDPNAPTV